MGLPPDLELDEADVGIKMPVHMQLDTVKTMDAPKPLAVPPPPGAPGPENVATISPVGRLLSNARTLYDRLPPKLRTEYIPAARSFLMTVLKLTLFSFATVLVVMLASWTMALIHWIVVVLGHLVLHYLVPESLDKQFANAHLDNTMIFAAIGAFIVNLFPFLIFLISFPCTVNRHVLERSAAPANELVQRITPRNRYARIVLKYAPRLTAGPIGCAVFWVVGDVANEHYVDKVLDPLHAAIAGVAGELLLTLLSKLKDQLMKPKLMVPDSAEAQSRMEEGVPLRES